MDRDEANARLAAHRLVLARIILRLDAEAILDALERELQKLAWGRPTDISGASVQLEEIEALRAEVRRRRRA